MKTLKYGLLSVILFVFTAAQAGVVINSGRGLPHTKSAFTTRPKQLWTMGQIRFWGKKAGFEYRSIGIESGSTFWVVQGVAGFNYGVSEHVSMALSPIIYQDVNDGGSDELFGDAMLDVKVGNYRIEKTNLTLGMNLGMRLPTGSHRNIIFEDYSSGRFEWGLTGLMTYRMLLPDVNSEYRIHLNLGYWNHNDKGVMLVDDPELIDLAKVKRNSQAFNYAFGLEFPTRFFDYGLEFYGLSWINFPPPAAAGRENNLFMNISVGYKPAVRFKFFTGLDLRLSKDYEETVGPRTTLSDLPNYPGWRVYLGLRYMILPTSLYEMHKQAIMDAKRDRRQLLIKQLEEQEKKERLARQESERQRTEKKGDKTGSEVALDPK